MIKIYDHNIKLAIFDLDGTLVDSTSIWEDIDKEFFARRNMEVPEKYCEKISFLGLIEAANFTKKEYGIESSADDIVAEWHNNALKKYQNDILLKPKALNLLKKMKDAGVLIGLCTANNKELYEPCIKRLKIDSYFDVVASVDKVNGGKNNPKIFKTLCEKVGCKPEETLVYDDNLAALKVAYENNFVSVAVYDKQSKHLDEEKKKYSYDFISFD